MKPIDSLETLLSWEDYRKHMKESLKLVQGGGPFYVSKEKLEFQIDGKPWRGHAVLAGERAAQSINVLKKEGVYFREGQCSGSGQELTLGDFAQPKLIKEAAKTLKKLKLGYSVAGVDAEGEDEGQAATPPADAAKAAALKELKARLTTPIKQAVAGNSPSAAQVVELARTAQEKEKAGDLDGAVAAFEEIEAQLASGAKLSPERREQLAAELKRIESTIDRLMAAL